MPSLVTRSLAAALLAAASLAAGAQTLLTQIPLPSSSHLKTTADVAVNSATNRIYVPVQIYDPSLYNFFRVLVIDGATDQVVHSLPDFPSGSIYQGIAIDPVRNFTYIEMGNNFPTYDPTQCSVTVVDGQTEETVKTIALPPNDCGKMVVDPVTGKVYIRTESRLEVIESEATGSIAHFSLPAASINSLAVSPYAHRLYFTYSPGYNSEELGFFDTLDDQISEEIHIPADIDQSANPVVNRETGNIFGTNELRDYSTQVTVYNSSGTLLASLALPVSYSSAEDPASAGVVGMDVDPKTNLAFAYAFTSDYFLTTYGTALYVIDGASNTVLNGTSVTPPPTRQSPRLGGEVAVNPDTSKVYVIYYNPTNSAFYLNIYSEQ